MNTPSTPIRHHHDFHQPNELAERSTWWVLWITLVAMVLEITAGIWLGSMALLADGWHMSSHAVAIGVSALAYGLSRRLKSDHRFAFGTWKIEVLGGFASALMLLGVAAVMVVTSWERLWNPVSIRFPEAIAVAVFGLLVNLGCAHILGRAHHHGHDHDHTHDAHDHSHEDLNLRSAYLHVLADALTSVLAIVALVGAWAADWVWLDPAMGIVGAVLVAVWSKGLLQQTSRVLLDREMDADIVQEIRVVLAQLPTAPAPELTDLHVWRVGRNAYACSLSLMSDDPTLTPAVVKRALSVHGELAHMTVEINHPTKPLGAALD
jgi:cation diffusion facilitator family transporter